MKKTNREKNQEHDARVQARVRPKPAEYNWKPLEDAMKKWKENEHK
jgi:hypothetical protein